MNNDFIERLIVNMAEKGIKENFLALNDKEKQREFNKTFDECSHYKNKIKKLEISLNSVNEFLEKELTNKGEDVLVSLQSVIEQNKLYLEILKENI